jgi:hypothetical protein
MRRVLFLLGVVLALAGCGGGEAYPQAQGVKYTHIDWLGNECFRITSPLGTSILTNPYAARTGGRTLPTPLKTDIVLVTTERPSCNNINAIDNQPAILRGGVGVGVNNVTGIQMRGIPSYRDPEIPASEGMNLLFTWVMDGMHFCFAGNLPQRLTGEQLMQIGTVDVLFLAPGALGTAGWHEVVGQLRPRLVIPMGTGAKGLTVGELHVAPGAQYSLTRTLLPAQTATLLFTP